MSGFTDAQDVERRGLAILIPYLKQNAHQGQMVVTSKGKLSRYLQQTTGDAFFNSDAQTIWSVEIKIERRATGNLFLESWSNRNLEDQQNHSDVGSNVGWMYKLRTDLLFYYFLDTDELYVLPFFRLKRWAFRHENCGKPRIFACKQVVQRQHRQLNDTWGWLVSTNYLVEQGLARKVTIRQLAMFEEPGGCGVTGISHT